MRLGIRLQLLLALGALLILGHNAFDHVHATSLGRVGTPEDVAGAVPEPGAWLLLPAGLLMLAGQMRRRLRLDTERAVLRWDPAVAPAAPADPAV